MNNKEIWEKEYSDKNLMRGNKPQKSLLNFLKFYKKEKKKNEATNPLENINVLDLGSGEGKNSIYLAEMGANVCGIEIAENAVKASNEKIHGLIKDKIKFIQGSMADKYLSPDNYFDIVLDVTSSNSLTEKEREKFLKEVKRVIKPGGYFFTRGLLKDGDKNSKYLLKEFPGEEKDTYVIPDFGLTERVFSKDDFYKVFGEHFEILKFDKETHYTTYGDRKYKRNFYVAYLKSK